MAVTTLVESPEERDDWPMRYTGSVTSVSWIPSEAGEGSQRLAFDASMAHYDEPLPDVIEDLEELRG